MGGDDRSEAAPAGASRPGLALHLRKRGFALAVSSDRRGVPGDELLIRARIDAKSNLQTEKRPAVCGEVERSGAVGVF